MKVLLIVLLSLYLLLSLGYIVYLYLFLASKGSPETKDLLSASDYYMVAETCKQREQVIKEQLESIDSSLADHKEGSESYNILMGEKNTLLTMCKKNRWNLADGVNEVINVHDHSGYVRYKNWSNQLKSTYGYFVFILITSFFIPSPYTVANIFLSIFGIVLGTLFCIYWGKEWCYATTEDLASSTFIRFYKQLSVLYFIDFILAAVIVLMLFDSIHFLAF